jgi:hypothetical protein
MTARGRKLTSAFDPSATVSLLESSHSERWERTVLVCFTEDYWWIRLEAGTWIRSRSR